MKNNQTNLNLDDKSKRPPGKHFKSFKKLGQLLKIQVAQETEKQKHESARIILTQKPRPENE